MRSLAAVAMTRYGPHDPSTAPTETPAGLPLHPDVVRQREQLNQLAHGTPVPTKAAAGSRSGGKVTDAEWDIFKDAVRSVAVDGLVRANDVRPLIRGRIFHKHIGGCYGRAKDEGLLVRLSSERSADVEGRNTHHDSGVFRLGAAA